MLMITNASILNLLDRKLIVGEDGFIISSTYDIRFSCSNHISSRSTHFNDTFCNVSLLILNDPRLFLKMPQKSLLFLVGVKLRDALNTSNLPPAS
jgi:hypothetical protein